MVQNYLYNQCLSPLMLAVRIPLMMKYTCSKLVVFSGYSGFLH